MSQTQAHVDAEMPGVLVHRAPESAAQWLGLVQRLWLELRTATPAQEPFIEREIRVAVDRYLACLGQEA